MIKIFRLIAFSLVAATVLATARADEAARKQFIEAALSDQLDRQVDIIKSLVESNDPVIEQALGAWRQGGLYLHETGDGARIPFLLSQQANPDGKANAVQVLDGQPLRDGSGNTLAFFASELTPVDTSSKLRRAIKTTLDLLSLAHPNAKTRRDAITKLGQDQNQDYLPYFEARLPKETDSVVRKTLEEAIALTQIASDDPAVRLAAVKKLGEMRTIGALSFLQDLNTKVQADPAAYDAELPKALRKAVVQIEEYIFWGNLVGTFFRGFSLSAVLLVVALGLAITFGLMGIINMAHGEVMMIGAYAAYVTQNIFVSRFGSSGTIFDSYFIVALVVAFFVAALVGLILERTVIRFLYSRPLESLLATWGVSLVLQQVIRATFGAANVQVNSPSWLSGSFVVHDVLFAYNRLFVIGFAVFIVFMTYLLLTRTPMGLQIRAVMQNRAMAACMGVRTDRINMVTFAFGSGLAGLAGACLSQIGNVGPSLGQNYIVDCFMIVVLGGVGNLVGTVSASFGVGITDQILQPYLGAVMGKITVLAAIILFLQWRPAGLFVTRSRSLEG